MTVTAIDAASRAPSFQAVSAGVVTAIIGYGSSFAIVAQGLIGVGATPGQAASGLLALSVVMGVFGVLACLRTRMPISIAWSTPGAALLATAGVPHGGFPAAVGAFLVAAALIVAAGLWRPLGRLVSSIPQSIANGMLAGILLNLCIAPFAAIAQMPAMILPVLAVWLVVGRFARLYAVPAAVLTAAVPLVFQAMGAGGGGAALWPHLEFVRPVFDGSAIVGIALPLFLVTMASQNIPGLAVLATYGYRPTPRPIFTATGIASAVVAPFGGHMINLAAITAALCAGPDAHPQPERRYIAGIAAGAFYVVLGLVSTVAMAFVTGSSPALIEAVAGLALIGAFGQACVAGLAETEDRKATLVTLLVTASGLSVGGIGSAFWGLAAGLVVLGLDRLPVGRG